MTDVPYTLGFFNVDELEEHFEDHGEDFGSLDAADYQTKADDFFSRPRVSGIRECRRPTDNPACVEVIRFHSRTREFGVLVEEELLQLDGTITIQRHILTYFRRNATRKLTPLQYYQQECLKRK